jgi:hypothetical protein
MNTKRPITGINPPFKNITETEEYNNPKNRKNNPDSTKEIVLLKIITSTY